MVDASSTVVAPALFGAAAWRDVLLPDGTWDEYAEAAAAARSPSEVYIALAIAAGVRGAVAAFESMYFCVIDRALVRLGASTTETRDVKVRLRHRLFGSGTGQRPLVVALAGQGQLRRELRRLALRTWIEYQRERDEPVLVAEISALLPAINALPEHARTVLRLCVLHGLGIAEIARRIGVDRAAAVKKLTRARQALATPDELSGDLVEVLVDLSLDTGPA